MPKKGHDIQEKLLASLQERAKELDCLYATEELLNRSDLPLPKVLAALADAIPQGWQHPSLTRVQIDYEGKSYRSRAFEATEWELSADITVQERSVGAVHVYYTGRPPEEGESPFLREEERLVRTIAERLGHFVLYQRLKELREEWQGGAGAAAQDESSAWRAPIHLLRESDKDLYLRIARKMLNHLARIGVAEAAAMLPGTVSGATEALPSTGEVNVPGRRMSQDNAVLLSDRPFELASRYISGEEIFSRVQRWMQEDKASYFMRVLNSHKSSMPEISDAIRRFHQVVADGSELPPSTLKSLRVSLTQRLLTEQLDFVRVAKDYMDTRDFLELLDKVIMPPESHGKLGGKSAGLLLANQILQRDQSAERPTGEVRVPRTWFIASDGLSNFIEHNDLQDAFEQKFKEIDQIRQEYPNIVQLFKSSTFSPRVVSGLSLALDDLGDVPLIIRSSSLLEDRLGTAFSGKYKSLFLANQGTKPERMEALLDAIAEVYASTFGPDPIEYRRERGLLEFNEEMGILVQAVVGTRVGKYFLPAFAGVAFSNNEFRWSPRIRREDGLIRLVPGLGTRAVDRVSDDYPTLVVPGQPRLRANVQIDEIIRYAPHKVDVINLETNTLDTVALADLMRECGGRYPALDKVFSVLRNDMLHKPVGLLTDPEKDELVTTFEDLLSGTPFIHHLGNMLKILEETLGTPVDIEFAHDGQHFYLLQCRPQSHADDSAGDPIPKDVPAADVVFTADRYVSNGYVPDITHVVYVDPLAYGELGSPSDMLAVGRAVGRLNKMLPKRQFILMGPGRWGSRGDIRLGVSVTYADISNTAMLIEIARQKGGYLPDLSFGTHFFQDLVESRIRYLPLYPDREGIAFNERFLLAAPNLLPEMLPDFAHLAGVLRVIEVPAAAEGRILRVLVNADLDEALGYLTVPAERGRLQPPHAAGARRAAPDYWQWRLQMAEELAARLDATRFGVKALYIFGSVKNASAGPGSDIDLLVHFAGDAEQRRALLDWLEGWSLCLAELNFLRTGYRSDGLLDVHLVGDEEVTASAGYAAKINAVTDSARELPVGARAPQS
ncbi:MAG: nucleotidyltransferase domain-containing protein [Candidatus Krumholzibacteriota bacterium]|nr:nucleotidyltransferase domain-containing protein [Candidatus Krumholzibacteriota bacterium]